MSDFELPAWIKYSVALLVVALLGVISEIPDLGLPSPQDPGWNPLIGFVHAVVVGVAFGLIVFTATIWSNRAQSNLPQRSLRWGVFAFLLFAGSDFALELLAGPFFRGLSTHADVQNALVRLVRAGRGWLLPLVFLTAFLAFMLLRSRRSH
jgi:hypothetical protein